MREAQALRAERKSLSHSLRAFAVAGILFTAAVATAAIYMGL